MPSRRVELTLYLVIAVLGVLPCALVPGATIGDGVDAFGTHWFYWWIRTCMEHFGDPSYTNLFFYPYGKDIFAHTGNNFVDAVLAAPLAWLFGARMQSVLWTILIQLGNVAGFRPLARYVFGDTFAAFAATLLWAVNPFPLFELTAGRPTQAMCWFLPAAVLYFLRCAREPGWRNAIWLGIAFGVSGWTYWFTGFFLCLLLIPLGLFELRDSTDRRGTLARWAVGALVCAAIVAPGVWTMVHAVGTGRVPGIDPSPGGIFVPPKPIANNVSADLHGIWLMEFYGAPLLFQPAWGLPLSLAAILGLPLPGGKARWIVSFLTVLAFAGGTMFRLGDHAWVMPHYMVLYRYLPFFDRLWFPYRMAAVFFIPAAILVGALCARFARGRLVLGGLVILGLAGQVAVGDWPFNYRISKAPEMIASLKDQGGAVIFLPMKIQHDGLMWQTEFQLPTFGGMGESAALFWPANFRQRLNNSLIKSLRGASLTPNQPRRVLKRDREVLEQEGFRWIILRRSLVESELRRQLEDTSQVFDKYERLDEIIDAISDLLGHGPVGVDGDAVLWDLQETFEPKPEWAPTQEHLDERGWEEIGMPAYEQALKFFGRTGGVRARTEPTAPK